MRRPVELLRDMRPDELAGLLLARPDLARPVPHSLQEVAQRASAPGSLWPAVRDLDAFTSSVLHALCLLHDDPTITEVAMAVGADSAATTRALDRLAGRLLADVHGGRVRLLPTVRQVVPNPGGLGPGVREALAYTPLHVLRQIVSNLGERGAPDREVLVSLIERVLRSEERLGQVIDALPAEVQDAVHVMGEDVSHRYRTSVRPWDGGPTRSILDWAQSRGLIAIDPWGGVTMPREVGRFVRGETLVRPAPAEQPPVPSEPGDPATIDGLAGTAAVRVVGLMAALIEACDEQPLALLKSGGVGIREVRRIAKHLDVPEPEAARLLEVALVADLIGPYVRDEVIVPGPAADTWMQTPPAGRWRALAEAWLISPRYPSLAGAPGTDGKPVPVLVGHGGLDASRPRHEVLDLLADVPPGAVPDPGAVVAAVAWRSPLRWSDAPARVEDLTVWTLEEAELLGVTAQHALSTAGRALLAGDAERAEASAALPPPLTSFTVQADLTALVPGVLEPALASVLADAADQESGGAASMWRFSEASVRRALDRGRTAEELEAFVAEHATHGVPQALSYLISDVARRHGHLRVAAATTVVHSDDPALLAEVVRHRRLAKLHLRLVAPTVAVGSGKPADALTALRAAGYLPVHENADGTLRAARAPKRRADLTLREYEGRATARAPIDEESARAIAAELLGPR